MPILDEPKFPVIDRAPGFIMTVRHFRPSDYLNWAILAIPAFPYGYFFGCTTSIPKRPMYFFGSIGVVGGFLFAYQSAFGRLTGLLENDLEVDANGMKKPEPLLDR